MRFYDWRKTLTYSNADVVMVVGGRGIGKTYGLRKRCIIDYIEKGKRFVEVVRFQKELDGEDSIIDGYFDKFDELGEFPEYIFKTKKHAGYIAKRCNEDEKPDWQLLCYFAALTDQQSLKKKTFSNVGKIIFDEAILDSCDRYHNYLSREYDKLSNLVSTITRQLADGSSDRCQLFLLGNALDLVNPYFQANGIDREPDFGFSWHNRKTFLLHYVDNAEYQQGAEDNTIAGRMVRGRAEAESMFRNRFSNASEDFIAKKPSSAEFVFGLHFEGDDIAIWIDWNEGLYFLNGKMPGNARPVFTLTTSDNRMNYIAAEKCNPYLKSLQNAYYSGDLRYDNQGRREAFKRVLNLMGIR